VASGSNALTCSLLSPRESRSSSQRESTHPPGASLATPLSPPPAAGPPSPPGRLVNASAPWAPSSPPQAGLAGLDLGELVMMRDGGASAAASLRRGQRCKDGGRAEAMQRRRGSRGAPRRVDLAGLLSMHRRMGSTSFPVLPLREVEQKRRLGQGRGADGDRARGLV
jgi:hypothetical protein